MSISTKKGDSGNTRLYSGQLVRKTDSQIKIGGELDELQAILGLCRVHETNKVRKNYIYKIQNDLQMIMGILMKELHIFIEKHEIKASLDEMEIYSNELERSIRKFKWHIAGEEVLESFYNLARTIARRCERHIVALVDNEYSQKYDNIEKNEYNQKYDKKELKKQCKDIENHISSKQEEQNKIAHNIDEWRRQKQSLQQNLQNIKNSQLHEDLKSQLKLKEVLELSKQESKQQLSDLGIKQANQETKQKLQEIEKALQNLSITKLQENLKKEELAQKKVENELQEIEKKIEEETKQQETRSKKLITLKMQEEIIKSRLGKGQDILIKKSVANSAKNKEIELQTYLTSDAPYSILAYMNRLSDLLWLMMQTSLGCDETK